MLTVAGFALDLDGKSVWKSSYVEEWKGEYKCNEDHLFNLTLTSRRIMHGIMYIMQWFILASEVVPKWNNVPFCNGSDQWGGEEEVGASLRIFVLTGHCRVLIDTWCHQQRQGLDFLHWWMQKIVPYCTLSWTWNVFYPVNNPRQWKLLREGREVRV